MANRHFIAAAIIGLCTSAYGQTTMPAGESADVSALRQEVADLRKEVAASHGAVPTTAPAPAGWQSILLEGKPVLVSQYISAGYKDGFYLKDDDRGFDIKVNGLFDARYSYVDAKNKTDLTTTALGAHSQRTESGFDLTVGQVSISGDIFHNVFFKVMGNFATLQGPLTSQGGTFNLSEMYAGYKFAPEVQVRVGMMIIPFMPLRSTIDYGGLMFPDAANTALAILPGYSLGADVKGSIGGDRVSYDLLVCNGANANTLTDSTLPGAGRDNRVAVYTREQWAVMGKTTDFLDESDTQDHQTPALMLGGGFGYESQNSTPGAFPSPRNRVATPLSSATGAGFTRYVLDGNAFRYIGDVKFKYHGLGIFGEAFYQHLVNTGPDFIAGYPEHSIGQIGWFAEAGYFVVPKRLELAGRYAQLYTNGLGHTADEIEFGVNYYIFGQNLKLQMSETYLPRQAALTATTGSVANTQDWITKVQVQLKF